MGLTRYSRPDLINILNDLAIEELATATERWECTTKAEESTSLFRMGLQERLQNVSIYRERIRDYSGKAHEEGISKENSSIYMRAVELLEKLATDEEEATLDYQKELYGKEKNIYNSRSYIEFPLDKKPTLNALYDDFSGVYLFYDDISTLGNNRGYLIESYGDHMEDVARLVEKHCPDADVASKLLAEKDGSKRKKIWNDAFGQDKVDVFESIKDKQERIDFVSNNIEFTHCMLGGATNPNWGIGVYGELDKTFTEFTEGKQQALPCEYCDFDKITLADTLKIKNQDLMQLMQAKIDIDRENLEIIDEREVRGDLYRIVKTPKPINRGRGSREINYLIRFVCPSTGRVYHVDLVEEMLDSSKYYKSGDTSTYIHAWWHITHGGADPLKGPDVIRC